MNPRDRELAEQAWIWIEKELNSAEDFDFLFVAGHYEIVSSPGIEDMALYERLLPIMRNNKATAYFQGHRNGFEHFFHENIMRLISQAKNLNTIYARKNLLHIMES